MVVAGCLIALCQTSHAGPPWLFGGRFTGWGFEGREELHGPQAMAGTWYNFPGGDGHHGNCCAGGCDGCPGPGGSWLWMRSPEEEKVVSASLFNRYCIRCHGVDGRGIWDMPRIPDFTSVHWQECRSDAQIACIILEGRPGCMPPFREALTVEQAWGLAHYLRTFVPGTETPRPDLGSGAANRPNPEKKSP